MNYSSYQVERLLDRLRRISRRLTWPAHQRWRGADPVRVSGAARESVQAAGVAAATEPPAPGAPPPVTAVRDARRFPPVVEEERERRAGSFMRPPYPDEPPPPRIPKRAPDGEGQQTPRPRVQSLGDAD